jgi:hypothetical protein
MRDERGWPRPVHDPSGALTPAFPLVLEERNDGVRPVSDVVERLLVADPPEADDEDVQLLRAERVAGLGIRADSGVARVRLGLTNAREAQHRLVVAARLVELIEELVDALPALRRQRLRRGLEVFAVVIGRARGPPPRALKAST